jgi:hypothetical protein
MGNQPTGAAAPTMRLFVREAYDWGFGRSLVRNGRSCISLFPHLQLVQTQYLTVNRNTGNHRSENQI